MAKGARKKTKWVSLSLASATATTNPPTENETDEKFKSSRGRKSYTAVVSENSARSYIAAHPSDFGYTASKDDTHHTDVSSEDRSQNQSEGGSSTPYSSGHSTYSHRAHTRYSKSSHNYYHSSGKSYHGNHYGSNSYHRSSSYSTQYTADAKNEQNEPVSINEDEYTKITTPRQDVLFKKGYLSRPKRHTTATSTMSDNGAASVNGTTDGSDTATGSGSVSTAESVTSDTTYLTEGQFMEYPTPYPYFGYFDQSGVLVMNGFAVDNNGFSYMNGGQTYIYPPNYHCSATLDTGGQVDVEQVNDVSTPIDASEVPQATDSDNSPIPVTGADLTENVEQQLVDAGIGYYEASSQQGDGAFSVPNEAEIEQPDGEKEVTFDSLDPNVALQTVLPPYGNGYDYAQFYNAYYYPGCVMAPFPVLEDAVYYEQLGVLSEEEYAKQFSFKKRKKWYRSWEEYPTELHEPGNSTDDYSSADCRNQEATSFSTAETPVHVTTPESYLEMQQSSKQPVVVPDATCTTTQPSDSSVQPQTQKSEKSEVRSHPSNPSNPVPRKQPKAAQSHPQKSRKRDLIESTLAFAEQNIDLTKSASRLTVSSKPTDARQDDANVWRTVRNGREVPVEENRDLHFIDTSAMTKMDAIEELSEATSSEEICRVTPKLEATDGAEVSVLNGAVKSDKKGERTGKKVKKTAKGKGRKQKKFNLSQQQRGFEVIEPEFTVSVKKYEESENELDVVSEEPTSEVKTYHEETNEVNSFSSPAEECLISDCTDIEQVPEVENEEDTVANLEQDLYNVRIDDLHLNDVDVLPEVPCHYDQQSVTNDESCFTSSVETTNVEEITPLNQEDEIVTDVPCLLTPVHSQPRASDTYPEEEHLKVDCSTLENSNNDSKSVHSQPSESDSYPEEENLKVDCSPLKISNDTKYVDSPPRASDIYPEEEHLKVECSTLANSNNDSMSVHNLPRASDIYPEEEHLTVNCSTLENANIDSTLVHSQPKTSDSYPEEEHLNVNCSTLENLNDSKSVRSQSRASDIYAEEEHLTANCSALENSNNSLSSEPAERDFACTENNAEEDYHDCKHFSEKEYSEDHDSGLQSPAAYVASTTSGEERKASSSSYNDSDTNLTEAVTNWLSETLRSKRLDEMFVLPEDPTLLHKIHQFNIMNLDDFLVLSSDTYSSTSADEAEDADSDYMSDVQIRKHLGDDLDMLGDKQKTESQKDPLVVKQTANGHHLAIGDHSNHKQKRCIIM
ncbi:uncharacterized protein LOC131688517 [Topomyia yanbarensis]|uniref:uncharacterized protein LOC131688517 n=1 Tax=Topomyia yanbarensis TaxID=2498891 RepID=UPI00273AD371|nr:uncharacterized protein LOC131688517 [Topomyia yanbarensis]XP_058828798.1 uncharacterized protein LOC131688517 [Topomyia yanbarensis]XP_058828799.1 uncharacterized protein LOC131688517 [Topomyia yanbarensis]